ncbi:MAG: MlaD family protein, partial [Desulfosarcinaceae bacterium]
MASLKTKFSVGLFLVIGIAIVIVAVIWLGMSGYLEKGRFYVSYFNESVQGLDKDSPVKYRGVSIGRVTRIIVAPDGRLIEVVMKIESDIELQQQAKDIVAQLSAVGITGLMFIEMDRNPPGGVDHSPVLDFEPPYPVIPTRPSEISKFFQGVQEVFDTLRALDTRTISKEVIAVLNKINKSIDEIALEKMGRELHTSLLKLQGMVQ